MSKKIVHIEVGNITSKKAEEFVQQVRKKFETDASEIAKDVVLYLPMRDGVKSLSIETIVE